MGDDLMRVFKMADAGMTCHRLISAGDLARLEWKNDGTQLPTNTPRAELGCSNFGVHATGYMCLSEQWLGGEVDSEHSVPQKCAWMGVAVCVQQGGGNSHGEMPYLIFYHSAAKLRLKSPPSLLLARITFIVCPHGGNLWSALQKQTRVFAGYGAIGSDIYVIKFKGNITQVYIWKVDCNYLNLRMA